MTRNGDFLVRVRRARSTILMFTAPFFLVVGLRANVVSDWNAIASTTIVQNAGKPPGAAAVYFAYSSLAVYDAVNAITEQYRPFYYQIAGPADASIDVAAAVAAHRILVNYFPAQQAALDTQLASSLANIVASGTAKDKGTMVGEGAASALISARTGDGLEANITYVPGSGPGAWIPTPPAFAPPLTPWLGQMRPFTMKAADDFLPGPPPSLDSETWKRDYNLTRLYGDVNSTVRSANEAEIGVFWTDNGAQYARVFNMLVANYQLGTSDAARLMAMVWTGDADAAIGCFNAKYKYGFWRPVTAIPAGGGSSGLTADPAWLPLATTPAHPEYPAAHGCVTGAVSSLIADFFGTTRVHIVADSKVFTDAVHQHIFEDSRDLMDEVFWARIYAGFHFHHSLEVGRQLGENVADGVAQNHFRPRRGTREDPGPEQPAVISAPGK
jgi:hypothetical protein